MLQKFLVVRIIGRREKVSFGTVVNCSKSIQLVWRFISVLLRLFFLNHDSLRSKHGIYFVTDIDERVICLVFQLVDPNHFNVFARNVGFHVKLHLI